MAWGRAAFVVLLVLTVSGSYAQTSFGGASSFYLHTFQQGDMAQVLDAMKQAGMKTVRIFITAVSPNSKGSNNRGVNDVEWPVGTWDDTVLNMIDYLMYQMYLRGMKLIIALHDRYSLGCWGSDAYVQKYSLPVAPGCSNIAQLNNLTGFYRNSAAAADMDRRFAHIVAHRNAYFGGRPWSNIPEAVLSFNIQNEGQAHLNGIPNPNWICDRATRLKPLLNLKILVSTGGGDDFYGSLLPQHFQCGAIDIVDVHSYSGDFSGQLPGAIRSAYSSGKRIIVEEFGATGGGKASWLQNQISQIQGLGVPWMVWEVVKPNNYGDYEIFTDDTASWSVLSTMAKQALSGTRGAFSWPELFSGGPVPSPVPSPPPPPGGGGAGGSCNKCNVSPAQGGCKCDNNCNCKPGTGGAVCDKCNITLSAGGCKCNNACACIPTGAPCDKCNLSPAQGGCKCDNNCNCKSGTGGYVCDKCNIALSDGGCKCDNNCACIPPP